MKTTIIPAQITTVEDKIVGNLNFSQILLLILPVFWSAIVYAVFPTHMRLLLYKAVLIGAVTAFSVILSIRVKDKLIFQWVQILLRFNLRPKYYVFNKNDQNSRQTDSSLIKKAANKAARPADAAAKAETGIPGLGLDEFIRFESLLNTKKFNLSFKPQKKGGINVAFEQVEK